MSANLLGQDLNDFRWKNRLLLLMAPQGDLVNTREQLALFAPFEKDIEDRELIILVFDGEMILDKELKATSIDVSKIPHKGFQGVLLFGKDGGIKLKQPFYVTPIRIFDLIDSMPMRQSEKRRKNSP
ncbi:DUF4174 domain-containing protein [uncultured Muriicola sp.]|uniref:DUF4174 domain-containing protein n=1 Tax=uncultured Muriicola sp. TaxID=1583102 RepID=UPI00260E52EE|nr:DUF4174 domain-containing protein [uncultured Muriicola sp.]